MSINLNMGRADQIFDGVEISSGPSWEESFQLQGRFGYEVVEVAAGNLEQAYELLVTAGIDMIMRRLRND